MKRPGRRLTRALATFLSACLASVVFAVVPASPANAAMWWPRDIANTAKAQVGKACDSFGACGWEWCSLFTKWVWAQRGVPYLNEIDAWAASVYRYGQKHGTLTSRTGTPHLGDVVVFVWNGDPNDVGNPAVYASHVAIVTAINGDTITTVGGNEGSPSRVRTSTWYNYKNNTQIKGFVSPAGTYSHLVGRYSLSTCNSTGANGLVSGRFYAYSCWYNGYYGNYELWATY